MRETRHTRARRHVVTNPRQVIDMASILSRPAGEVREQGSGGGRHQPVPLLHQQPARDTDPFGLWVWPWDPNASWNPIATGGLWIGGLNDVTLKPIARAMWGWVIDNQLEPMGYDAAAILLSLSLQDNPSDLYLAPCHFISKNIAASGEYNAAKQRIISGLEPGITVKDSTEIRFEEGDLFAAFHVATMDYSACRVNVRKVTFHATIKDRYDFDLQVKSYYGGYGRQWLAVVANNMAWSDQFFGVVQNYDIEAKIE